MRFELLLLLFLPALVLGQNKYITDHLVKGFVTSDQGTYLVLEEGYVKLPDYDPYEEYYRTIYNDSTIVNPNRIISGNYSLNIIPYLMPEIVNQNVHLEEPLQLGLLFQINEADEYELSDFAYSILDSLIAK